MVSFIFFFDELVISLAILSSAMQLFKGEDLSGVEKLIVMQSLCLVVVAVSHFAIDKGIQGVHYAESKVRLACGYGLIRL